MKYFIIVNYNSMKNVIVYNMWTNKIRSYDFIIGLCIKFYYIFELLKFFYFYSIINMTIEFKWLLNNYI